MIIDRITLKLLKLFSYEQNTDLRIDHPDKLINQNKDFKPFLFESIILKSA